MSARFDRQGFLGKASDELFNGLRVAIVGLGGGGSHIAQQLAHIGVGHFVLVDPDRIEVSNLNRLVGGTSEDVRQKEWKVRISSRKILSVKPKADVIAITSRWQEEADSLRDCDVLFGCVDTFTVRNELERFARRYLIPYIDMGMDVHHINGQYFITGQVALSMPSQACLHCMSILREDLFAEEAAQYGAAGARPQVIWPNGVLASTAVGVMVQLVTPWHREHYPPCLLEYDGNLHEVRASASVGLLQAMSCSHFLSPDDLGDPWFDKHRLVEQP